MNASIESNSPLTTEQFAQIQTVRAQIDVELLDNVPNDGQEDFRASQHGPLKRGQKEGLEFVGRDRGQKVDALFDDEHGRLDFGADGNLDETV